MVKLTAISFSYGNEAILNKLHLQINAGDFLHLFGADDSGKTTLLHIMMGFITKFKGKVKSSFTENTIRYVPDDIIWEHMTATEYFNLWQAASPKYDPEWQTELCEVFAVSPESSLLNMTYNENKSVQLIAAICAHPDFLVLDEPANFLDEKNYAFLLKMLRRLNEHGMTILLATEKYADAMGYCRSYAYLKEGNIFKEDIIPYPDFRWKVVSVIGGNQTYLSQCLDGVVEDAIARDAYFEERDISGVFWYQGEMKSLPNFLHRSGCKDFTIDEMTLEEELNMDFSRWRYE